MQRATIVVLGAMLALGGCAHASPGPDDQGGDRGGSSSAQEPPECTFPYAPPYGFAETRRREVPAVDHVGVQQVFRNDRSGELILTSGIAGEFGEGLPTVREEPLASGAVGSLIGEDQVWLLIWDGERPCTPLTVTANGMTRRGFISALVGMGLVAGGDA